MPRSLLGRSIRFSMTDRLFPCTTQVGRFLPGGGPSPDAAQLSRAKVSLLCSPLKRPSPTRSGSPLSVFRRLTAGRPAGASSTSDGSSRPCSAAGGLVKVVRPVGRSTLTRPPPAALRRCRKPPNQEMRHGRKRNANRQAPGRHERLIEAVETVVSGEDWKRMLKVASKFHRYSFNNQLLIFLQRPDATARRGLPPVAGARPSGPQGWEGHRHPAPCKYRVPPENGPAAASSDGKPEEANAGPRYALTGFRVVYVFDVSQTDGEPIEDFDVVRPRLPEGEAPEGLWDALVVQAKAAGFQVVREQRGSKNGFCDFSARRIGIRPDVNGLQAVKTLAHELAHALLHGDAAGRPDREIAEVEVESVAFVVLDALGLASDDYGFPYVARWASGKIEAVRDTASRVIECSRRILGALWS